MPRRAGNSGRHLCDLEIIIMANLRWFQFAFLWPVQLRLVERNIPGKVGIRKNTKFQFVAFSA